MNKPYTYFFIRVTCAYTNNPLENPCFFVFFLRIIKNEICHFNLCGAILEFVSLMLECEH